jgi:hypothetical protein
MHCENSDGQALLGLAVERADAISDLVGRLAGGTLAAASEAVAEDLRALAASEPSHEAMAEAVGHVARLDSMLTLAITVSARRARRFADRLAVAEEFSREPSREPFTAVRAAALADRLADHSRLRGQAWEHFGER